MMFPMTELALTFFDPGVFSVAALVSLLALTLLEVVLGIDNIVFIAILTNKLPEERRASARRWGLGGAMLTRIALLFAITWVLTLDKTTLFTLPDLGLGTLFEERETIAEQSAAESALEVRPQGVAGPSDVATTQAAHAEGGHADKHPLAITGKELILFVGGLFLLGKATYEIHDKLEGHEHADGGTKKAAVSFGSVIAQIMVLDVVFSIDSVITAVGIAKYLLVMVLAVMVAVGIMLVFAGPISRFVEKHPTIKMLALSFLILIGLMLVVEAFEVHIPKGYIYFAMGFALLVEMLNIRLRTLGKKPPQKPVTLRQSYVESKSQDGYGDVAAG